MVTIYSKSTVYEGSEIIRYVRLALRGLQNATRLADFEYCHFSVLFLCGINASATKTRITHQMAVFVSVSAIRTDKMIPNKDDPSHAGIPDKLIIWSLLKTDIFKLLWLTTGLAYFLIECAQIADNFLRNS